ncbi:asparagine synthase [Microbacterium candidum]|uniref:Asparagine synthase n=1 Tax=Microbacterium candidum TaxID=3041922 RepID=A0ABT7MWK4_9MICO|nr:asparagine synthase [Microbacterium sp. ASV49]MDL9978835.1 asparagine synthase [Microbacterium sp. ASV49]
MARRAKKAAPPPEKTGDGASRVLGGDKPRVRDQVAEGVYIAAAATRLALKNRMLVEILAGGADFDVDRFVPEAKETLLALADEADEDAERTRREGKKASRRFRDPYGSHDYSSRDVRNLRRRRKQSERIAAELRERAGDDAQLRELVEAAREAAWADVSRNIDRTLRIEAARPDLDPDYEQMREARMQSLRLVDLPRLAAHKRRLEEIRSGETDETPPDS